MNNDQAAVAIPTPTRISSYPKIYSLIKAAQADIEAEAADEIKRALYKWAKDRVLRGAVAGLAEWYKEQLMQAQFNPPQE